MFTDSSAVHPVTRTHWGTSGNPLQQPAGLVIVFITDTFLNPIVFKRLVGQQSRGLELYPNLSWAGGG